MNPLNRRMFRQPGMSRQPAGILASSPQLANTVANRQPVRMANGGTNTYTAAVQRAVQAGDKRSLQELAKPINYGAAARTPDAQNALRLATQALAQSTRISTDTAVDAPVSDAERMAASRANLGALRGRVSQDALTDQAMAQINAANRPSKPPVTFAERGIDGPPNMDAMGNVNTSNDDAMQAAMQANVDTSGSSGPSGPSLLDKGIAAAKAASKKGMSTVNEFLYGTDTERTPIQAGLKAVDTGARVLTSSAGDLISGDFMRPVTDYLTTPQLTKKGVKQADIAALPASSDPDEIFPGEQLAQNTATSGSGTDPDADADASITNNDVIARKVGTVDPDAPPPKTAAVKKLEAIRNNITSNVPNRVKGKAPELSVNEALDPEVLPELANNIADRVAVKDVDLDKIDAELKKEFNFDPSKASKEKEGAFWTALMQAGLAIAAGESENALTNIAKGLSLGVDAYGKAVGELNEQEREDRKEMRQARRQLIRDERSFNIADAAAANQYKQYMNDANQRFEVNKRTLGIQQATLEFNKEDKRATLALNMQKFDANLAVLIAGEARKDEELVISKKTLQAAIDKLKPEAIRLFEGLKYIDSDGNVTPLGVKEFGGEAETRAELLARTTKSSTPTDTDDLTKAYITQYGTSISSAQARILAEQTSKGNLKDFGSVEEAIKELFGKEIVAPAAGNSPPVIDLSS